MSYLGSACCVPGVDGESNESVCDKFGTSSKGEGMKCTLAQQLDTTT